VAIDMVDIAFQPNAFTITAGTGAQGTFTNPDQPPHPFTCDALGIKAPDLAPRASENYHD
jgi:hypothetical protein